MSSSTDTAQVTSTIVGSLPAPSGVIPNFDDPANGNTKAYIVIILNLVVMLLLAAIRAFSRIFIVRKLRIEDWLGLISVGGQLGFIINEFRLFNHVGWFVAGWNVPADKIPFFVQLVNYCSITYNIAVGPLKMAILFEWSHIFVPYPTRNTFWWICHILIFINGTYYFIGLFLGIFSCVPREYIWNKELEGGGTCINSRAGDLSSSALNLFLDVAILLLPQGVIWDLNLPFRRRLGIATIFAVGLITCAVAAVRLKVTVDWLNAEDVTFWAGPIILWACTESTCIMFVFCLPAVPKLFGSPAVFSRIATSWRSLMPSSSSRSTQRMDRTAGAQKITLRPSLESDHPLHTIDIGRVSSHASGTTQERVTTSQEGANIRSTTHFSITEDRVRDGPPKLRSAASP